MRLDICLMQYFGVESRNKAQSLIMRGDVSLNHQPIYKSGFSVKEQDISSIQLRPSKSYVGFGAYKLLEAIRVFNLCLKDKIALDIGSSTGGFTQVLLESGASLVYAVDVGENQLDYSLRENPRVIVYEKTNARTLDYSFFQQGYPNFFTVDVSFISLSLIFPTLKRLNVEQGIVLIKPQFEVGREINGFKGYVRDEKDIQKAIDKVKTYLQDTGFELKSTTQSPEQNDKKNKEILGYIVRTTSPHS